MKYIINPKVDNIISIYPEVFLVPFPEESYYEKIKKGYHVFHVEFWEQEKLIGFCLVIDKKEEAVLHCWIGGILPKYRKKGVFSGFLDWIIQYGSKYHYAHITLNTDNNKPAMLKLLVKYGFCIIDVKKSEYGDGHKLISIYDICTPRKMRLSITDRCNMDCFFCHSEGNFTCNSGHMPLSAIEQLLIQANRMNFTEITITGGEPLTYLEGVLSVVSNCSRWIHPPKIKICTNGLLLNEEKIQIFKAYPGKFELNISMHTIYENVMSEISRTSVKIAEYSQIFNLLYEQNIDFRINYVLLNGVNDSMESLVAFFDYALHHHVKAVHFLELLVTKEQTTLFRYYQSIDKAEEKIKALSPEIDIVNLQKTNKKTVLLILKNNSYMKVTLFRLSCRCGCESCFKENDIKIGADMLLHPCYLEHEVNCGNAVFNLKEAVRHRDEFMSTRNSNYVDEALYWGD